MKTRKEICEQAGILESTFTFYRLKGLLPDADGLRKRQAVWDETIVQTIAFIKESQAAGMSLDAIGCIVPSYETREQRLTKALRKIEEVAQNAADDPVGPWSAFAWIINHANDAIEGK